MPKIAIFAILGILTAETRRTTGNEIHGRFQPNSQTMLPLYRGPTVPSDYWVGPILLGVPVVQTEKREKGERKFRRFGPV